MKKSSILIMLITLVIITIATFVAYIQISGKMKGNEPKNGNKYYHDINYSKFKRLIDDKENIILVIHQTGCPHCANYLPIIKDISKEYEIDVYSINISNLSKSDKTKFDGMVHYSGTPTTIFFFNGEERTPLNRIIGESSKATVIERLKSLGLIDDGNE